MEKPTLYVSFDVETDGQCPLVNNMLSLGIYFLDKDCNRIFTYNTNFELMENHTDDQKTMEFWSHNREMYELTRVNQQPIIQSMYELSEILANMSLDYKLHFVAMPACFDWMFLKCYYEYAKKIDRRITFDIGFKCHCFSSAFNQYTLSNNMSGKDKEKLLNSFCTVDSYREHNALYDAQVQGIRYVKFLLYANVIQLDPVLL